ncbi:hypothetical protein ACVNSK_11500, partial [Corynebacterium propinquum]
MPTVSGNLVFVSSRAAQVSEVWLHAREVRTHDRGVVTTGNDRFPVQNGQVEFTALPGPAVLALISQGMAMDAIPIVVGESEAQSLRNVVRAAQVADETTSREIERLSAEMMEALDSVREEAKAAQGHAATASTQATKSENAANRLWNSVSWRGDRLSVAGRQSDSLTGPQGPPGPAGSLDGLEPETIVRTGAQDTRLGKYLTVDATDQGQASASLFLKKND